MIFILPGGLGQDAAPGVSTFNPAFVPLGVALSNNNRTMTGTGTTNYGSVQGTKPQNVGKVYFEVTFNTQFSGSTGAGALAGLSGAGFTLQNNYPGQSLSDWGVGSWFTVNQEINNAVSKGSLGTPANGDVAMVAVDFGAGGIWFGMNGTWFNGSGPAATADYTFTAGHGVTLYPTGFVQHLLVLTLNVGNTAFTYPLPTGFVKWG